MTLLIAVVGTLLIAAVGNLLAVFVADLVAHIAVHAALPDRAELVDVISVSSRALAVMIVLPMIFVGLAGVGCGRCPPPSERARSR